MLLRLITVHLLFRTVVGQGFFDWFGLGTAGADPFGVAGGGGMGVTDPFMGGMGGIGTVPPDPVAAHDARLTQAEEQMAEVLGESARNSPERQRIESLIQQTGGRFAGDASGLNYLVQEYLMTTPGPGPQAGGGGGGGGAGQRNGGGGRRRQRGGRKQGGGRNANGRRQRQQGNRQNGGNLPITQSVYTDPDPYMQGTEMPPQHNNVGGWDTPNNQNVQQPYHDQHIPGQGNIGGPSQGNDFNIGNGPNNRQQYQDPYPPNNQNRQQYQDPYPPNNQQQYNDPYPGPGIQQQYHNRNGQGNSGGGGQPPQRNSWSQNANNRGPPPPPQINNNPDVYQNQQPPNYNQGPQANPQPTNNNRGKRAGNEQPRQTTLLPEHQPGQARTVSKQGGVAADRLRRIENRLNSVNEMIEQAKLANDMAKVDNLQKQLTALNGVKMILSGGKRETNSMETLQGSPKQTNEQGPLPPPPERSFGPLKTNQNALNGGNGNVPNKYKGNGQHFSAFNSKPLQARPVQQQGPNGNAPNQYPPPKDQGMNNQMQGPVNSQHPPYDSNPVPYGQGPGQLGGGNGQPPEHVRGRRRSGGNKQGNAPTQTTPPTQPTVPTAPTGPTTTTLATQLGDTRWINGVKYIYIDADNAEGFQWVKESTVPRSQLDHLPQYQQQEGQGQGGSTPPP